MKPEIPTALLHEASEWDALHRWERKQLGMTLRRLGLTYSEIQSVIPVPKSTLSNWSRDVALTRTQIAAMKDRTGSHTQRGIPRDTQRKRRLEIEEIRSGACDYFANNSSDPLFATGVSLYWAEGSKTRNDLSMTNTDPRLLSIFIAFVRVHLDTHASFGLSMHLHEGDDETASMRFWRRSLGLPDAQFTKTYVKPAGTGHRKKKHPNGVCRVRVKIASDHWHAVMQWIDNTADLMSR
ncbi:MAG: hypothetical protein ACC658_17865 [Acidimicrobiia bacterium]